MREASRFVCAAAVLIALTLLAVASIRVEATVVPLNMTSSATVTRAVRAPSHAAVKGSSLIWFSVKSHTSYLWEYYQLPWNCNWIEGYDTIFFYTSNDSVASFEKDDSGVIYVVANKPGTATITAKYAGKKATMKITVKYAPVEEVVICADSNFIDIGETVSFYADVCPDNASPGVRWTSSNRRVVKVDKYGNITGLRAGTATIGVYAANGKMDRRAVTVNNPTVRRGLVIVDGSGTNGADTSEAAAAGEDKAKSNDWQGVVDMFDRSGIDACGMYNAWSWSEVRDEILTTFADADGDDVSYLYIGAHGGYNSFSGDYYISVGNHNSGDYAVSAATLRSVLDQIPGRKVLLIDSCQSGASINRSLSKGQRARIASDAANSFTRSFICAGKGVLSPRTGEFLDSNYYVLCSATMDHLSYFFCDWQGLMGERNFTGSAFAYAITKGCGWNMCSDKVVSMAADRSGDKRITLDELFKYTASTVKTIYQKAKILEPASVAVYPAGCSIKLFMFG